MINRPSLRRLAIALTLAAMLPSLAACRGGGGVSAPAAPKRLSEKDQALRADYVKLLEQFELAIAEARTTRQWRAVSDMHYQVKGDGHNERFAPDLQFKARRRLREIPELAIVDLRELTPTEPGPYTTASNFVHFDGISPELKAELEELNAAWWRTRKTSHEAEAQAAEARGDLVTAGVLYANNAQGNWNTATNVKPLIERGLEAARPVAGWKASGPLRGALVGASWPSWMDLADEGAAGTFQIELVAGKLAIASGKTPTTLSVSVGTDRSSRTNDKIGPLDAEVDKWRKKVAEAEGELERAFVPNDRNRAQARIDEYNRQLAQARRARGSESETIDTEHDIRRTYDAMELWTTIEGDLELRISVPGLDPIVARQPIEARVVAYSHEAVPELGIHKLVRPTPTAADARAAWYAQAGGDVGKVFDKAIGGRYGLALASARGAPAGSTERTEKIYVACMIMNASKCFEDGIGHELAKTGLPGVSYAWNIFSH